MAKDDKEKIATLAWVAAAAGIWLLISRYILTFPAGTAAAQNAVSFGIIIAAVAATEAIQGERLWWLGWLNTLLGVWVLISPWVLNFSNSPSMLWNHIIVGLIVLGCSAAAAVIGDRRFHHGSMP